MYINIYNLKIIKLKICVYIYIKKNKVVKLEDHGQSCSPSGRSWSVGRMKLTLKGKQKPEIVAFPDRSSGLSTFLVAFDPEPHLCSGHSCSLVLCINKQHLL